MEDDFKLDMADAETRLDATIKLAVQRLKDSQSSEGCWTDCFDTGVMADAHTAICLFLLDVSDPEWIEPLLNRILAAQRVDGSWGVYPGDEGDLSTTVECYYALDLYHCWFDHRERQELAKQFILQHGGLRKCRNLTKVILAIGGEIPWTWLPSPGLYSLLFSRWFPVAISDIVTFTRLHIAPILLLSSVQFVEKGVHEPVLSELLTSTEENYHTQDAVPVIRRLNFSPFMLQRLIRCLDWMLDEREEDGTAGSYHSSTFLLIFALRSLGYNITHPEIQVPLQAIRRNAYQDPLTAYVHQQTCNAHVWNTALVTNALLTADPDIDSPTIQRAVQYLLSKQHHAPLQAGGWGFSSNNTRHPDTDDTVACLEALYPFRMKYEEAWRKGVNWLLSMQNRNGGWSAFEKNSNKRWLEWIPANDMRRTMYDPSTPDITGRVLEFLLRKQVLPLHDSKVRRALRWLLRHQEPEGCWFGRWGTTYIYGTWCAIKALAAAKLSSDHRSVSKAKEWLLNIQHQDGSFGESCQSDLQGRFVPLTDGVPTQTAWGLDALLHLHEIEPDQSERERLWEACGKAADWLLHHANHDAEPHGVIWTEDMPTGSAFPGALHIRYHVYPKIWPLIALAHYRTSARQLKEGPS
ncbi:prenyltransferase/squalene oxidase repeat-containing protein [Effusibacillus dendaii]|uniref:Squalene--hopene cyclase n=1 Tax=Effusibacillus dendaii TaxID=2743772 RepID=A0A7I8D8A7_9BACL|nr:prenyltransferase/squalene oxidase repeat-containing protein [Effusibacillus dendaii]BCJ85036.1 squalene--hopene cyclase [Effusibacillus dendaii]